MIDNQVFGVFYHVVNGEPFYLRTLLQPQKAMEQMVLRHNQDVYVSNLAPEEVIYASDPLEDVAACRLFLEGLGTDKGIEKSNMEKLDKDVMQYEDTVNQDNIENEKREAAEKKSWYVISEVELNDFDHTFNSIFYANKIDAEIKFEAFSENHTVGTMTPAKTVEEALGQIIVSGKSIESIERNIKAAVEQLITNKDALSLTHLPLFKERAIKQ